MRVLGQRLLAEQLRLAALLTGLTAAPTQAQAQAPVQPQIQAQAQLRSKPTDATPGAGNVWTERSKVSLGRLGTGFRLQLGADTGIGPLYLGLSFATQCQPGLVLFIGRP